jgi:hypothetical protein
MVYLDEAGISKPDLEPFVVVAGVMIHADKQWHAVEAHLSSLTDRYVPPAKREGFSFHATELFSGGKTFTREEWPKEERWTILDQLVAIPGKFELPVVAGWVARAGDPNWLPLRKVCRAGAV